MRQIPIEKNLFAKITGWGNLLEAYRKASRGKRGCEAAARFDFQLADRLIDLQTKLQKQSYRPGGYVNFYIHEPKKRKISAAPFRDRVVHHAICNVIEPYFERRFIYDSYANRKGKGTHRAVDRLQHFSKRYRYVLRLDIVKHFPAIDHAILLEILYRAFPDDNVRWLVRKIIASGSGVLDNDYPYQFFPDDDRYAPQRTRGLPIGNLTSQFWSNCYLNLFDHFVKRELRCKGYLRYVDDMAFFSDSKSQLYHWKNAVIERLAGLRLKIHPRSQAFPVTNGTPWLGFIVYPTHRRIKGRNVRNFNHRLLNRWDTFCRGNISFAEFDSTVQGWINHVRFGDTWNLRTQLLGKPLIKRCL